MVNTGHTIHGKIYLLCLRDTSLKTLGSEAGEVPQRVRVLHNHPASFAEPTQQLTADSGLHGLLHICDTHKLTQANTHEMHTIQKDILSRDSK